MRISRRSSCCIYTITVALLGAALMLASCAMPPARQTESGRSEIPPAVAPPSTDTPALNATTLRAAPRLALVIGNGAYSDNTWGKLNLTGNDAEAIGYVLKQHGYTLIGDGVQHDVSSPRFRQLIDATEQAVRAHPGAVVVVYFSGHGFVDHGHNYLVPIDAPEPANATQSSTRVVDIALRLHSAGSSLTAMFLDACRDIRSNQSGGLTDESVPPNTFVGFSAEFGAHALEPPGEALSYYANALRQNIEGHYAYLGDMHLAVAKSVMYRSIGKQTPTFIPSKTIPALPMSLAAEPQTAIAQPVPGPAAASDTATAQCIAGADFRLIFSGLQTTKAYETARLVPGPVYEQKEVTALEKSCAEAYASGRRDPGVLRGLAVARIVQTKFYMRPKSEEDEGGDLAMLAQAAESGDTLANLFAAIAAADSSLGLTPNSIQTRLIAAAERNEPPVAGVVGMLMWAPTGANFRIDNILPADNARGIRIFRAAAMSGDPFAATEAFVLKGSHNPALVDLSMRDVLNKALASAGGFGVYIKGTTLHETLLLFAIMQSLHDRDWGQFVRVVTQAAPSLDRIARAFGDAGGPPMPTDKVLFLAGCMLNTGRDQDGKPIEGITTDHQTGVALVRRAVAAGLPNGQEILARAEQGTASCAGVSGL